MVWVVANGRERAVPWGYESGGGRTWDEVGVSQIAFGDIRAGSACHVSGKSSCWRVGARRLTARW